MTSSNIDGLIDDVNDTSEQLRRGARQVADDEGQEIKRRAIKYYTEDPEWLGRTKKAIRQQLRRQGNGIYDSSVYVNGLMAPHAKIAEMGSGDKANQSLPKSATAASKTEYRGDHQYDAPSMSRELRLSILAWVKTKPIYGEGGDEEIANTVAANIAKDAGPRDQPDGTYQHPFIRPAWEDRAYVPAREDTRNAPVTLSVENMVLDSFN
jgi:ElaB/YqjD/DUF883 family membrane-anchored ribosome-binding protein